MIYNNHKMEKHVSMCPEEDIFTFNSMSFTIQSRNQTSTGRSRETDKTELSKKFYKECDLSADKICGLVSTLELRQYKNDSMGSKCMLFSKLPPFIPHRVGEWKSAEILKKPYLLTPSSRSYIVLAL